MKTIIINLALMCLAIMSYAQDGIKFEKNQSWLQIKTKAKVEKKYIFLDAYATWCTPCKFMDSIYSIRTIGSFINDKFISVKVQMDSTGNDNEEVRNWYTNARKMMKEYKIDAFPTLLFFDPNGNLVHKITGAMYDTTFVKVVSDALNPQRQYYTRLKAYKNGKLGIDQMPALAKDARYLKETAESDKIAQDYINNYLLKLKEEKLFTKENLEFIKSFIQTDTKGFNLFMKQSQKVNTVLGKDQAEYVLRFAIAEKYIPKSDDPRVGEPDWAALKKTILSKFGPLGQEALYGRMMIYYLNAKDWSNFGKYYILYFEKALARPEYNINNISWKLFLNINDPTVLAFAVKVMKYDIETWDQNNYLAYDTYANLLYKTGMKEDAVLWEERALKLSNHDKVIEETLNKMKKKEPTWQTSSD